VLEPFAPMAPGVFLYYPGGRQMTPKLRAFIDHVKSRSDSDNKIGIGIDDERTRRRRRG
jgi:DNA-binding transcriptional LysR family regulator